MSEPGAKTKPIVRYEDAAEFRTDIRGWVCKACRKFYGATDHSEQAARCCCATDFPCEECGGRKAEKYRVCCRACADRHEAERWAELLKDAVDWDGTTPVALWNDDRYFFDGDALQEYIEDCLADGVTLDSIRVVLCEQQEPRAFDMADFLSDDLSGDARDSIDFDEIDKFVNDWIEKHVSPLWCPANKAIRLRAEDFPMPEDPSSP